MRDRARFRAVISADSSAGTMPSLSVVQTLPPRRRKDAPALSLPGESQRAVQQAVGEPFEADRNLVEPTPSRAVTRRSHGAADHGLANAASVLQPGLFPNK